jgi:hypothetical protein
VSFHYTNLNKDAAGLDMIGDSDARFGDPAKFRPVARAPDYGNFTFTNGMHTENRLVIASCIASCVPTVNYSPCKKATKKPVGL